MARRLRKTKDKLKQFEDLTDKHFGDKKYLSLLARYRGVWQMYDKLQKEMGNLKTDFEDTIQQKLTEQKDFVVGQIKMELKEKRAQNEEKLRLSILEQKENLKTLDRAFGENKISKELHSMATALISKVMEIPEKRLRYLIEQYIAFRAVKESQKRTQDLLKDDGLTSEVRNEMEAYMKNISAKLHISMKKWHKMMHSLDEERCTLYNSMWTLFNEVLVESGVLLIHPLMNEASDKMSLYKRAAGNLHREKMRQLFRRNPHRYSNMVHMPILLAGNTMKIVGRDEGDNWSPSPQASQTKSMVNTPHTLNYDINGPCIEAQRTELLYSLLAKRFQALAELENIAEQRGYFRQAMRSSLYQCMIPHRRWQGSRTNKQTINLRSGCVTPVRVCVTPVSVCVTPVSVCVTPVSVCVTPVSVCDTSQCVCDTSHCVCDTSQCVCDTIALVIRKRQLNEIRTFADDISSAEFRFGSISSVVNFGRLKGSSDDDWIDRINHLWTVVLLGLFAVIVTSGQFVGDPIQCWIDKDYDSHAAYIKSICWISNTYYIPMDKELPTAIDERKNKEITYYQWVPVILLFMALLFKLPNVFWRMSNDYAGVNLDKITTLAESTQAGSPDDRAKNIKHIARYMDRWLQSQRPYKFNVISRVRQRLSNAFCFWFGRRNGTFLIGLYIFIKLLYCANLVGQFYLLNAFLSMEYSLFGFELLNHAFGDTKWDGSHRFPRVTMCDFDKRQLQNVHKTTVQCVLPVNLFNEKVFVFLWFWIFFVAILTFANCASWLIYVLFKQNRPRFVGKYLKISNQIQSGIDKKLCRKFADDYLRADGVFVLRVVEKNSTSLVLTDLVNELWTIFKDKIVDDDSEVSGPSEIKKSRDMTEV
ncbi:hypothetical protein ScPMuIL_017227 [Solemya velum]